MFILNCKSFKRISNDHFHIELLDRQLTDIEPISTITYWREMNYRAVQQADKIHQVVGVRAVWSLNMRQEILQITFPVCFQIVSLTGLFFPPSNSIHGYLSHHDPHMIRFLKHWGSSVFKKISQLFPSKSIQKHMTILKLVTLNPPH